jgi:serine/threonine protein kinase/tetratricopeptide (TPR) repeat protein
VIPPDARPQVAAGVLTPAPPKPSEEPTRLAPPADAPGQAHRSAFGSQAQPPVRATGGAGPAADFTAAAAAGPLVPGQAFGPRYQIIRLLGVGGMGAVYQALDDELSVAVALKVIRPDVMADPCAAGEVERRFKRELLLARQVTHRNVVRIHDLGEVNGVKYITMPFIEGESLARLLASNGKLLLAQALPIAKQIAAGLAAAHEAGVVHRDLKPENVMIEADGRAIIMDFGISRSATPGTVGGPVHDASAATVASSLKPATVVSGLTMAGAVLGTVDYMAPEQARAEPVDERADIYSFGLMLRDMLVGSRRVGGASAVDELMARINQAPPAPHTIDPQIPEPVDRIVCRCLEPDPAARYQTSQELVSDLERLDDEGELLPEAPRITRRKITAVLLLVLGLLGGTWWLARTPVPPPGPEPVEVLIADFENRTGDPVFDGALEQALAIGVEGASFIGAYPRADALRLSQQLAPGKSLDLERARLLAGREGIKIVLAGAIEPRGSGYRVAVRIVDPIPGKDLARVQADASDKSEVLQKVAKVASDLRAELGDTKPASERLAMVETFTATSLEAARSYSIGQELQWAAKYEDSIPYYRKALEADPKFGRAYANWAVSASYLGRKDESEQLFKQAFAFSDRMTEREKYRTYGSYYLTVARNYEKAIENYTKLVELYPADRSGHGNLAVAYFSTLNFAKAREEGAKAVQLYPASLKLRNNLALYAMYAGDFAGAEKAAAEVVKADSSYYRAYLPIAIAAAMRSDMTASRAAYQRMGQAGKQGRSLASTGLADLALYEGRFDEAIRLLREGIAYDESIANPSGKAAKLCVLAEALAAAGVKAEARAGARSAAKLLREDSVLLPAARVLVGTGDQADARAIAQQLGSDIHPYSRAYGKVVEGEIALRQGRVPEAVDAFRAAQKTADLWLTRFSLGVGYIAAGAFPEALAELEACQKRRGEATALFLDDVPTIRYLATLPYWLGRAREGVGMNAAALESYKAFLALRPNASDPLTADARRRLGL